MPVQPQVVNDSRKQHDDDDDDDDESDEDLTNSYIPYTDIDRTHQWEWDYTGRNEISQILNRESIHPTGIQDEFLKKTPTSTANQTDDQDTQGDVYVRIRILK